MAAMRNPKVLIAMVEKEIPTIRELARRSEVHESQLSYMLRDRMIPTKAQAKRIAKVLDRKPDDLFENIYQQEG